MHVLQHSGYRVCGQVTRLTQKELLFSKLKLKRAALCYNPYLKVVDCDQWCQRVGWFSQLGISSVPIIQSNYDNNNQIHTARYGH
jgi:hypothetical protein